MIEPSGIQPLPNQKLKVREVTSGLYTLENTYEGVYEYFTEPSVVKVEPNASLESLEDWRKEFGTETKLVQEEREQKTEGVKIEVRTMNREGGRDATSST
ncbi:hypothetical protein [Scytonema sp. NUACC26]|uniref:hypothetical protein n=1 Tax=Scytonema sp. NUACC26 TaxID=3140176 RepID=UPI0034DC6ED8